ncbi:hypothetical protein [Mycolicibacter minnesotensis]
MSKPAPVDRPPTTVEADIMRELAIAEVADRLGLTLDAAAEALDRLSTAGRVRFCGDALAARIEIGGHRLIETPRDWLAFRAALEDCGGGALL